MLPSLPYQPASDYSLSKFEMHDGLVKDLVTLPCGVHPDKTLNDNNGLDDPWILNLPLMAPPSWLYFIGPKLIANELLT
jgi:hypothetical protein